MADQKLTALTALATLSADDLFYVVDDPAGAATSKKLAASVLDARFATAAQGALADTALQPASIGVSVQGYDATLAALGGLTGAADKVPYFTGADVAALTDLSAFGRSLIDDANQAAAQATLGLVPGTNVQAFDAFLTSIALLGTAADKMIYTTGVDTAAETALTPFARSILDDANEAAFKATVNLEIGVDVQAWDADLDTIAGLAKTDGNFIVGDGAAWVVESGATALASIGGAPVGAKYIVQQADGTLTNEQALGALATGLLKNTTTSGVLSIAAQGTDYYAPGGTDVAIADGGTGQSTAQAAIDALTNVAAATNEHVLTKDTATGNAIFKAAAGGSSLPVADTTSIVMGSADNTKLLRFEVDGFTAGATRVLTPPNANATIAGLEVANVFTAAQTIDGSTDTPQLIVKQHSTQDEDAFRIIQDDGTKVLGIRARAGYCYFETETSNDNFWFNEGFSVSNGANIVNVNYGGGIGFQTDGHIKIMNTSGQQYIQFNSDKKMAVGDNFTPGATLEIRQASTTAAIPTLWLKQSDLSEEFIRFESTVGAGNSIDTAALGAYYGKVRVYVQGVGAKWMALYD